VRCSSLSAEDRWPSCPLAALLVGLVIAAQGIFGLAAPEAFLSALSLVQKAPVIYAAAVIRVAFGVVLFQAASLSLTPMILRIVGSLIVVGGLLTPFFGVRISQAILDSWLAGGSGVVRIWAGVSFALGVFILYSVAPWRASRARKSPELPNSNGRGERE
jgi:hypothetical protein